MTNGAGRVIDRPWNGYIENLRTVLCEDSNVFNKQVSSPSDTPVSLFKDIFNYLLTTDHLHSKASTPFILVLDVKDDQPLQVLDHLKIILAQDFPVWSQKLLIYLGTWTIEFAKHAKSVFDRTDCNTWHPDHFRFTLISESPSLDDLNSPLYDAFNLDVNQITPGIVEMARSFNKDILLWTCNSEEEIGKARSLSVQGILTDDPIKAKELE